MEIGWIVRRHWLCDTDSHAVNTLYNERQNQDKQFNTSAGQHDECLSLTGCTDWWTRQRRVHSTYRPRVGLVGIMLYLQN